MTKIYGINGSPRRKNWNTYSLLESALKGAESVGAETELINLYDYTYKGCISCLACKRKNNQTNGKVYAFVYDSELFCKQLNKTKDGITAVSFNKEYDPFEIDKTKQFAVVGQVISAMKRI